MFANNSQRTNASVSSSLFCKLCYDAGRGNFDTHSIRDRHGRLTCKYLASISCANCGENGHTIKYCRVNNLKSVLKDGDWVGVGTTASAGVKKTSRRSKSTNVAIISNVLGGAFSSLVLEDEEEVDSSSPAEKCHEGVYDTNYPVNNCATATIIWANTSKPDDLFKDFKNTERRSWADMVDDD